MCDCRLTRNFFVHSAAEHFEYRGDDAAFAETYAKLARERAVAGDAPLPPMEEVLADIQAQRDERRRTPAEALERARCIESKYERLHPEVYTLSPEKHLHPSFRALSLELRRCPDKPRAIDECVHALVERGLLQKLRDGLFTFPVFTEGFCDSIEAELANFEASSVPKGRPNTMNRHGVVLRELGLSEGFLDPLVYEHVDPIATRLLCFVTETLDSYRAFTVKYQAEEGGDKHLNLHYDNAEVTLNVNLGGEWTGGQVTFFGMVRSRTEAPPLSVVLRRGHGVLHAGRELHQAEPVVAGRRQNLILWCRSSGIRNEECPMCFSPPRVVPANAYTHDGFSVPPCQLGVAR